LVCLTGAVQSASFIPFLKLLRRHFCKELKVLLTDNASTFVTVEALTYQLDCDVYRDMPKDGTETPSVEHIMLSQWPDCVLVAPATASSLWRIGNATCNDLLSLTITALDSRVPVVVGPSMNEKMWLNPGVQHNLKLCHERGYWIIQPGLGVEVSSGWNERKAMLGVFGPQPLGLLKLMASIFQLHKACRSASNGESTENSERASMRCESLGQ
jgi:phosphopantothenoylcysteine decarboxylase/phosphopantothenate--cysteine ligase